jgi:hypothetical protein
VYLHKTQGHTHDFLQRHTKEKNARTQKKKKEKEIINKKNKRSGMFNHQCIKIRFVQEKKGQLFDQR